MSFVPHQQSSTSTAERTSGMLANTTPMAQPNVFAQPRPTPSTNNFDLMRAGRPVPIPQLQESYESLCKVVSTRLLLFQLA